MFRYEDEREGENGQEKGQNERYHLCLPGHAALPPSIRNPSYPSKPRFFRCFPSFVAPSVYPSIPSTRCDTSNLLFPIWVCGSLATFCLDRPRINDNGAISADIVASLPGNALLAVTDTHGILCPWRIGSEHSVYGDVRINIIGLLAF